MTDSQKVFDPYAEEVLRLASATSTTEESYYPAIKGLLTRILDFIQGAGDPGPLSQRNALVQLGVKRQEIFSLTIECA